MINTVILFPWRYLSAKIWGPNFHVWGLRFGVFMAQPLLIGNHGTGYTNNHISHQYYLDFRLSRAHTTLRVLQAALCSERKTSKSIQLTLANSRCRQSAENCSLACWTCCCRVCWCWIVTGAVDVEVVLHRLWHNCLVWRRCRRHERWLLWWIIAKL